MRVLRVSVRQGVRQERNENPKQNGKAKRKGATSKIKRKSKVSCGSLRNRNHIWEVRSKALIPEMTKKPFKALLHRKADERRRFS